MRAGRLAVVFPILALATARTEAFDLSQDVAIDGYVDTRLIAPSDQTSWLKGGLGKLRFGPNRGNIRFVEAVLQADATLTNELHLIALARAEPEQRTGVDGLEAYLHYRPKHEGDLFWSVKTGAFFPAIGFENSDLGWTSPYTLTPSAINTWIGEELRTIGSEATFTWRTDLGTLSAVGALYCCNDPAGVLIFDRGWAMHDRPTGLVERVPLPDSTIRLNGQIAPLRASEFEEIEGRAGWYAGVSWQIPGVAKVAVTRYDNTADAAARTARDSVWATRFWNISGRSQIGPLTIISQWMTGDTLCIPAPGTRVTAYFDSAFLLASYDIGAWRLSIRQDWFETRYSSPASSLTDEDGHAVTLAASWSATDWLRLTGEWVMMNSRKNQYLLDGSPSANRSDNQFQLSTRFFF